MSQNRVKLHFKGTDGAINFASSDIAREFRQVVHRWPVTDALSPIEPFAEVCPHGKKWQVDIIQPEPRQGCYDPVNGICDLVVELNWSRLRSNPKLMCLHAAGVAMGEHLIVFPSGRRSGKSTLTAELARRGHLVFSDDILAVDLDTDGVAHGLATGVAPRLRLPLPEKASYDFLTWVQSDPGPQNRQYKYLTGAPVAPYGSPQPLGAIVTLNRVDTDTCPRFDRMDPAEVLPILIHQNFGRFLHSGRALAVFDAVARTLPCLKLTYKNFEEAVDFLEANLPGVSLERTANADIGLGTVPVFSTARPPFDLERPFRQRTGFRFVDAGSESYIADADGVGIFRMGPGMLPIWTLLEEPIRSGEIIEVMRETFPDVGSETVERDVHSALRQLHAAGLIETFEAEK